MSTRQWAALMLEFVRAHAVDLVGPKGLDSALDVAFKGDMDTD